MFQWCFLSFSLLTHFSFTKFLYLDTWSKFVFFFYRNPECQYRFRIISPASLGSIFIFYISYETHYLVLTFEYSIMFYRLGSDTGSISRGATVAQSLPASCSTPQLKKKSQQPSPHAQPPTLESQGDKWPTTGNFRYRKICITHINFM